MCFYGCSWQPAILQKLYRIIFTNTFSQNFQLTFDTSTLGYSPKLSAKVNWYRNRPSIFRLTWKNFKGGSLCLVSFGRQTQSYLSPMRIVQSHLFFSPVCIGLTFTKGGNNSSRFISNFLRVVWFWFWFSANRRCCKICFTSYLHFLPPPNSSYVNNLYFYFVWHFVYSFCLKYWRRHEVSFLSATFWSGTKFVSWANAWFLKGCQGAPHRVCAPISKCHFPDPTANPTLSEDTHSY